MTSICILVSLDLYFHINRSGYWNCSEAPDKVPSTTACSSYGSPSIIFSYTPFQSSSHSVRRNVGSDNHKITWSPSLVTSTLASWLWPEEEGNMTRGRKGKHCYSHHTWDIIQWPQYRLKVLYILWMIDDVFCTCILMNDPSNFKNYQECGF